MTSAQAAIILRAISTSYRLEILRILNDSPEALASSLIASMIGISDGQASANLLKLADSGILMRAASGNNRFYSINRQMLKDLNEYLTQRGLK